MAKTFALASAKKKKKEKTVDARPRGRPRKEPDPDKRAEALKTSRAAANKKYYDSRSQTPKKILATRALMIATCFLSWVPAGGGLWEVKEDRKDQVREWRRLARAAAGEGEELLKLYKDARNKVPEEFNWQVPEETRGRGKKTSNLKDKTPTTSKTSNKQ